MATVTIFTPLGVKTITFQHDADPHVTAAEAQLVLEKFGAPKTCEGCRVIFDSYNSREEMSLVRLQALARGETSGATVKPTASVTFFTPQGVRTITFARDLDPKVTQVEARLVLEKLGQPGVCEGCYVLFDSYHNRQRMSLAALRALSEGQTVSLEPPPPATSPLKTSSLASVHQWLCYYVDNLSPSVLSQVQMAIVESEAIVPAAMVSTPTKPLFVAYLSLGEVNQNSWYWPEIQGAPYILERNPNWPEERLIDVRSQEWQNFVLTKIIPRILQKGYTALFFDTLDTAQHLETTHPQQWGGSQKAMVELARKIRERYPQLTLLANNGFSLLDTLGPFIDGVVVEDLYTRYDFEKKTYGRTPSEVTKLKEGFLQKFQHDFNKPVFVINYARPEDKELIHYAEGECRDHGFRYYRATVDLMSIGTVSP